MPKFSLHHAAKIGRVLNIGVPGAGKTGALASLANDGQRLIIADFDNGLDILHSYLNPDAVDRVYYETFTDKLTTQAFNIKDRNDKLVSISIQVPAGPPDAFPRFIKMLDSWKVPDKVLLDKNNKPTGEKQPGYDLGSIYTWGPDTTLVIDGLTFLSEACMRFHLAMKGADGSNWVRWYPEDYQQVQRYIEMLLERLKLGQLNCNVVVNSHLRYMGGGGSQPQVVGKGDEKATIWREVDSDDRGHGYPLALGRQLPPKIGSYFNSVILTETVAKKHQITTVSRDRIELKNPCPAKMPASLSLADGLAVFFRTVREAAQHEPTKLKSVESS